MNVRTRQSVCITGASGTLGYNIVRLLASDPRRKILTPLRSVEPLLFADYPTVHMVEASLADCAQMIRVLRAANPSVIVHCAASGVRPPRPAWFDLIDFNVHATLRLFEASCALSHCHFVYISTGLVYRCQGRPLRETDPVDTLHPYGASKAAAECLLRAGAREFGRTLTVLRPFSFTGLHDAGGRLFPSILQSALAGEAVKLSPGDQYRDFCSVQDIAAAVAAVLERSPKNDLETFNLGSGKLDTLRQTIERVCADIELNADLRFGELSYAPYEPMHLVADLSRTQQIPWQPKTNLSFAVWQLAQDQFPTLKLRCPEERC